MEESSNKTLIKGENNSLFSFEHNVSNGVKYNLVSYYKNYRLLFKWKDTYLTENLFERELGKSTYTFEREDSNSPFELTMLKSVKNSKSMKKISCLRKHSKL